MKKIFYILFFIIITANVYSQSEKVGINTTNPKGILHIDASGTGVAESSLVVDSVGNLGVGTLTPTQKLESSQNMLVTKSDTVTGNIVVDNNILVGKNSSLRIAGGNTKKLFNHLDSISSQLEIVSDQNLKAFRYDNGSQTANTTSNTMIPVLTKSISDNTVNWTNLPFLTDVRSAKLLNDVDILPSGGTNGIDITEPSGLTLSKGLWLVLASVSTDTNQEVKTTGGFYVWMRLENDAAPNTIITQIGSPTESKFSRGGITANGYGVSTPQLTYLLYVPDDNQKPYRITLSTSMASVPNHPAKYVTTNRYSPSYFLAIKLDYTNE